MHYYEVTFKCVFGATKCIYVRYLGPITLKSILLVAHIYVSPQLNVFRN